jgi:hypothetical protein
MKNRGYVRYFKEVAKMENATGQRLMEQAAYEANGGKNGGQLLNKRNPIAPNSNLYKSAGSSIQKASTLIAKGDYSGATKLLNKLSRSLGKAK